MLEIVNDIAKCGGKQMTGRDLIIFIMDHSLENELVISSDGSLAGLLTLGETAKELNVGIATVLALIVEKKIGTYYVIGNTIYIPKHLVKRLL